MVKELLSFGPCVGIPGGQTFSATFPNPMLPLEVFKGLKNIHKYKGRDTSWGVCDDIT